MQCECGLEKVKYGNKWICPNCSDKSDIDLKEKENGKIPDYVG